MFTDADAGFMARALDLAREGRFWAAPNPHVGCVLVRDGSVIGEGFTQPAGGDHAEVVALQAAGDARGATAYVTLEPCAHTGRTGPCTEALIDAGVSRVVAAVGDPNPRVAGAGLARLEAAGVVVSCGLLAAEARIMNRGFFARMTRGWGRVRLKVATSLDGRTAMASGESQWITGPAARADVQLLRAESSAIVTGSGTVLADDCRLSVRAADLPLDGDARRRATLRTPLRVVLDGGGRVPGSARVLSDGLPTLWVRRAGNGAASDLPTAVEQWQAPVAEGGAIDLRAVLMRLGDAGANEILVEAGPRLGGAFLAADLVDQLLLYQAPLLLGSTARPMAELSLDRLVDARRGTLTDVSPIGDDLRITVDFPTDCNH